MKRIASKQAGFFGRKPISASILRDRILVDRISHLQCLRSQKGFDPARIIDLDEFSITRDLGLFFSDTIPRINSASRQQSPKFKRRETERLLLLLQSTQQIRRYHRAEEEKDQKQEAILEAESTSLGMHDIA